MGAAADAQAEFEAKIAAIKEEQARKTKADEAYDDIAGEDGSIDDYKDLLKEKLPQFWDADFGSIDPATAIGQIGDIRDEYGAGKDKATGRYDTVEAGLMDILSGGGSKEFDLYKTARFSVLDQSRKDAAGRTSNFFGRRGTGGSNAALNALNRSSRGFDRDKELLTSQLGIELLGRQDKARLDLAGVAGQEFGMESSYAQILSGLTGQEYGFEYGAIEQENAATQSGLDATSTGLEHAAGPAAMDIALYNVLLSGGA